MKKEVLVTLCLSNPHKWAVQKMKRYGIATVLVAIFGRIYLMFSHGESSRYMSCAFLVPLVCGVFFWGVFAFTNLIPVRNRVLEALMYAGTATLTIGSIERGVLVIYGTTNRMVITFFYVAAVLYLAAALVFFWGLLRRFPPFGNSGRENNVP